MSNVLKDIEERHANYSKMLSEKRAYLTQVEDNIKQLKQEHKITLSHIAELTGAVNMGSQVIEKMKTECTSCDSVVDAEIVEGA